jgi:peroxin-4
VYTVKQTLEAVQQLLTSAEPDSPLNVDAAQLLRQGDHLGYEALVRFYTDTLTWHGD